jgi:hypothetical protein
VVNRINLLDRRREHDVDGEGHEAREIVLLGPRVLREVIGIVELGSG